MAISKEPEILYGVGAIAVFLGMEEKPCRHRVEAKQIPTFKLGGTICARPATLRDWLADLEAQSQVEADATALQRLADDGGKAD